MSVADEALGRALNRWALRTVYMFLGCFIYVVIEMLDGIVKARTYINISMNNIGIWLEL